MPANPYFEARSSNTTPTGTPFAQSIAVPNLTSQPNPILPHYPPDSPRPRRPTNPLNFLPPPLHPKPPPRSHQPRRQTIPPPCLLPILPLRLPNRQPKNQAQIPRRRHPFLHWQARSPRLNLHLRPLCQHPGRRGTRRPRPLRIHKTPHPRHLARARHRSLPLGRQPRDRRALLAHEPGRAFADTVQPRQVGRDAVLQSADERAQSAQCAPEGGESEPLLHRRYRQRQHLALPFLPP